jgi:hypothetical protein
MTTQQLQMIESTLNVVLPEAYKQVMASYPWPAYQGSTEASLWDDPSAIVEQTQAQRAGFGDSPQWPQNFVVIGDEDDACPYALDCATGRIVQTDHGNLKVQALAEFLSIAELVAEARLDYDGTTRKSWWKVW